MRNSIAEELKHVHPQMLKAESESLRKKLAIGKTVARTLEILGKTKQEAAFEMGYSDQGVVSRWCSGTERPQFDKLFALDRFEECYIVALAEQNPRMEVQHIVKIRRSA